MVGKTSLVRRFVDDTFTEDYIRTLGVQLSTKQVEVPGTNDVVELAIWDIGRRTSASDSLLKMHFREARGAFVVFDVTREETFTHVPRWARYVRSVVPDVKIVVLGNKCDLPRCVDDSEVERACEEAASEAFYWTSAKTGENVDEIFQKMANLVVEA
ncbi:MAG: Rab family GTPase [Promethearchaeota archaeon]